MIAATLTQEQIYDIIHANLPAYLADTATGMIARGDGGKLVVEFRSMDSTEEPIATINLRDEYLDLFSICEKEQDKQWFIAELRSLADELEAE